MLYSDYSPSHPLDTRVLSLRLSSPGLTSSMLPGALEVTSEASGGASIFINLPVVNPSDVVPLGGVGGGYGLVATAPLLPFPVSVTCPAAIYDGNGGWAPLPLAAFQPPNGSALPLLVAAVTTHNVSGGPPAGTRLPIVIVSRTSINISVRVDDVDAGWRGPDPPGLGYSGNPVFPSGEPLRSADLHSALVPHPVAAYVVEVRSRREGSVCFVCVSGNILV